MSGDPVTCVECGEEIDGTRTDDPLDTMLAVKRHYREVHGRGTLPEILADDQPDPGPRTFREP